MMRLITIVFILFQFCLMSNANGQSSVILKDAESEQTIEGAQIMLTEKNGKQHDFISSPLGEISLPAKLEFPCEVVFQHLSYQPLQIIWEQIPKNPIQLKPSVYQLDDVVVTGQISSQSLGNSIFAVRTVDAQTIEAQGAVDLSEVLSNQLNLTLTPDNASGRTSVSLLGLGGEYVKVLIDGVPFVGANGNGNDVDLSQINLNNVERIEIVEGNMGVSYGANAVAGVINIITKKTDKNKLTLSASVQEESVGGEYGLEKGRHIQTVGASYRVNEKMAFRLDFRRNDFKGFLGERAGDEHIENDARRGFEWQPKVQNAVSLGIDLSPKLADLQYKVDYFHQKLIIPNPNIRVDEHASTKVKTYSGQDNHLASQRMAHSLNASGRIAKKVDFKILTAYSDFHRDDETIRILIPSQVEDSVLRNDQTDYNVFMSRGNFTNFFNNEKVNLELGYELNREEIRMVLEARNTSEKLTEMAGFANMEFQLNSKLSLRTGARIIRHSLFDAPLIYTGNLKYVPQENWQFRLGYGRAYRTPNLTELYFYFVDANHNVQGNPNLLPEGGYTYSLDISRTKKIQEKLSLESSFKLFYNDIENKITLGLVDAENQAFKYININAFKSKGVTLTQVISSNRFQGNIGFSYTGLLNDRTGTLDESPAEFLYATEFNSNLIYSMPKQNLEWGIFFKRTGKREQFAQKDDGSFTKGQIDAFNWLDFTLGWQAKASLKFTIGGRNLLNITNVNSTAGEAGAHTPAGTNVALAYGRSYFVRVAYRFEK
ncbi:MAG: outer membrane receptor for ferrienterochelin and colicins [Bacteroidia bacterium]|jgi:outer membrane receptor for ferrienterochelin and colicins